MRADKSYTSLGGHDYYKQWGKEAIRLKSGDVINIASGIKHLHGAERNSWFSHLAMEFPAEGAYNEWLEAVEDDEYNQKNQKNRERKRRKIR